MVLDKNSLVSDGVADLYRAALFLARKSVKTGVHFLKKAQEKLPAEYKSGGALDDLARRPNEFFEGAPLFWAEKVLDEYQRLKIDLSHKVSHLRGGRRPLPRSLAPDL